MISAWHLLWIIPLAWSIGFLGAALLAVNSEMKWRETDG